MALADSLRLGLAYCPYPWCILPVTFLTGIPHATTTDDVVQGYHVPKGAINIYYIL